MQEGCKKSVKDKNAEKAKQSFKKLRGLIKTLEKRKCLGNRSKVISSYFDFNDFEFWMTICKKKMQYKSACASAFNKNV